MSAHSAWIQPGIAADFFLGEFLVGLGFGHAEQSAQAPGEADGALGGRGQLVLAPADGGLSGIVGVAVAGSQDSRPVKCAPSSWPRSPRPLTSSQVQGGQSTPPRARRSRGDYHDHVGVAVRAPPNRPAHRSHRDRTRRPAHDPGTGTRRITGTSSLAGPDRHAVSRCVHATVADRGQPVRPRRAAGPRRSSVTRRRGLTRALSATSPAL